MSALLDKIDELLEQYDEWEKQIQVPMPIYPAMPKFEVADKSSAEWVLRKIAKLTADQEENHALAKEQIKPLEEEIDKIHDWEQAENRKLQGHIDFLKSFLEPYHRKILEADPKAKTINLPHGEMKIRAQQPEIQKDDTKLLDWLKSRKMTDYIKTEETPKWGELKKLTEANTKTGVVAIKETGEVVDGVTASEKPDKFEVITR